MPPRSGKSQLPGIFSCSPASPLLNSAPPDDISKEGTSVLAPTAPPGVFTCQDSHSDLMGRVSKDKTVQVAGTLGLSLKI